MSVIKKQHFVPQSYLRRFADESGKRLWVLDLVTSKVFHSNIKDVAARNHFYDTLIDNHIKEFDSQGVEKLLGFADAAFPRLLSSVMTFAKLGTGIPQLVKHELTYIIWLQLIRTEAFRQQITPEKLPKIPKAEAIVQIIGFQDEDLIARFRRLLEKRLWVVRKASGKFRFPTTDNPLLLQTSKSDLVQNISNLQKSRHKIDELDVGFEFTLPLDPEHILVLYDPAMNEDMQAWADKVCPMNDDAVIQLGFWQVIGANRQIFFSRKNEVKAFQAWAALAQTLKPHFKNMSDTLQDAMKQGKGVEVATEIAAMLRSVQV
jgi:Protein of unknown function (DUF4238)